MIAGIRGILTSRQDDIVVVATAGGTFYEITLPVGARTRLPADGQDVFFHTAFIVKEDGFSLFGFDNAKERTVFMRLISASGVGPRLALNMISSLGIDRVVTAIQEGDLSLLSVVPGVGQKKAERMVLELRDKMDGLGAMVDTKGETPHQAAIKALTNLGYSQMDADSAVRWVLSGNKGVDTAALIRKALEVLTKG